MYAFKGALGVAQEPLDLLLGSQGEVSRGIKAPASAFLADAEPTVSEYMAGDVESFGSEVIGDKAGLAILQLVDRGRLLRTAPEIGELPVVHMA